VLDRDKLIRILGMLGSAHDGEVLSAARQAQRLVREAGLTWEEILTIPAPRVLVLPTAPSTWQEKILDCLDAEDAALSDWERGFLLSVRARGKPLTEKQRQIVDRIYSGIYDTMGQYP
jgi:hypothetical protein